MFSFSHEGCLHGKECLQLNLETSDKSGIFTAQTPTFVILGHFATPSRREAIIFSMLRNFLKVYGIKVSRQLALLVLNFCIPTSQFSYIELEQIY